MGALPVIATNKASAFALIRRASSCRDSFSIIEAFFSRIEDRREEGESGHHGEKTDGPLLSFHLRFVNLSTKTYRVGKAERAVESETAAPEVWRPVATASSLDCGEATARALRDAEGERLPYPVR